MKKTEFLRLLRQRLSSLPNDEAEKSAAFYSEAIDDRTEEGMSEEEAVEALGSLDYIVGSILQDSGSELQKKTSPMWPLTTGAILFWTAALVLIAAALIRFIGAEDYRSGWIFIGCALASSGFGILLAAQIRCIREKRRKQNEY